MGMLETFSYNIFLLAGIPELKIDTHELKEELNCCIKPSVVNSTVGGYLYGKA